MILRNYFLINLVLLILVIFLGIKAFNVTRFTVELPSGTKPVEAKQESVPITPKIGFPGESVFQVISDKNIFSPSRELIIRKSDNGPGKAGSGEVPKFFGTIIIGSSRSAMLMDTDTKRTKRYFVNDTVGDFVIKDIQEDRVVLLTGDETIELKLRENKGTSKTAAPVSTPVRRDRRERTIIPTPNIKLETPVITESEVPVNTEDETPASTEKLIPVREEGNGNPQ